MSETLSREGLKTLIEAMANGRVPNKMPAYEDILATDAALREQLEEEAMKGMSLTGQINDLDKRIAELEGYFAIAEQRTADAYALLEVKDKRIAELEGVLNEAKDNERNRIICILRKGSFDRGISVEFNRLADFLEGEEIVELARQALSESEVT